MARSDSQIDTPQRGHPKRVELPDAKINTGVQSINTEKASLTLREGNYTFKSPNFVYHFYIFLSASWIHGYFDDVMTKIINKRTDR